MENPVDPETPEARLGTIVPDSRNEQARSPRRTSRRGVLRNVGIAAAATVGAGALFAETSIGTAKAASTVTYTASGEDLVLLQPNVAVEGDGTNGAVGILGSSDLSSGVVGLAGTNPRSYLAGTLNAGVSGISDTAVGISAFSHASTGLAATTSGAGQAAINAEPHGSKATAVVANASDTAGGTGLAAYSDSGTGITVQTGGDGVTVQAAGKGVSAVATNGIGVSGVSQNSTGVAGETSQPGGWAVAGIAFGSQAIGVYGEGIESGGPGVFGISDNGVGVQAQSGSNFAVDAQSINGTGVRAKSSATNGVGLRVEGLLQVIGNAVGRATFPALASSVLVVNPAVTTSSTILITPIGDPGGRLWVSNIIAGSFVIGRSSNHGATPVMYLVIN